VNGGKSTLDPDPRSGRRDEEPIDALALVVVWAEREPTRLGEVLLPTDGAIFGRGPAEAGERRVAFLRQRPQSTIETAPSEDPFLSRLQLRFRVTDEAIEIDAIGRRCLRFGEGDVRTARIVEGDVVELEDLFVFYCTRRPPIFREGAAASVPAVFGGLDELGIAGESVAAWALRGNIAFAAQRNAHVLVTGASGTGKELVAQAIHRLSSRGKRELVARNAATFPSGLIDAELFGNMQNYPNAGMVERPGLVGQADKSTLFLDEIGELPAELQSHLLRLLDGGEYQRLGESKQRRADIRLIAATNRPAEELKHDLAARLALRIHVPGLDERREDVMLLARHLLTKAAASDPQIGSTFFANWNGQTGQPRISPKLARALVMHSYSTHVRELEALLWKAASSSKGKELQLTDAVQRIVKLAPRAAARELTADGAPRAA
jgi:hypothetical protein